MTHTVNAEAASLVLDSAGYVQVQVAASGSPMSHAVNTNRCIMLTSTPNRLRGFWGLVEGRGLLESRVQFLPLMRQWG